jgi:hypothetical protein
MSTLPEQRLVELVIAYTETVNDVASFEDEGKSADASIQEIANNPELKTDEAVERVIRANALKLLSEARAAARRQSLLKIETEIRILIPVAARRLREVSGNDPLLVIQELPTGSDSNVPSIDQARDLVRRFRRLEMKSK